MADIYMYADETGNLDLSGSAGASRYFGFGTAVFPDGHGSQLWEGMRLRCHLEQQGIRLPGGMHAKNDSRMTRDEVFEVIRRQAPRFDATFLFKERAHPSALGGGQVSLYRIGWYLHLKLVVEQVSSPGDTVFVVIGSLHTSSGRQVIRQAVEEVCAQVHDRVIVPCIWDAPSSWGIQVADYGLWAAQRIMEGRPCVWFATCVEPTLRSIETPWGRA